MAPSSLPIPSQETLQILFSSKIPRSKSVNPSHSELFPAWSTTDDIKNDIKDRTVKMGTKLSKDVQKASMAAQKRTGQIELYSGKYFAACTLGGLLACVSTAMAYLSGQY